MRRVVRGGVERWCIRQSHSADAPAVLTLRLALALHPLERVRRAGLRRFLSRPQPSRSAHAARAVQPPRAPLAAAVVVWRQHALPRAATGSGCPRPHGPPTPSRPAPAAAATATEARAGCVSRVLACTNDDQWHRACGAPPTCPYSRVQPQTRQEAADETISLVGGIVTSSPPAVHDVHSGIYNCNLGQRMLRAALSLPITRIHDSVSLSYILRHPSLLQPANPELTFSDTRCSPPSPPPPTCWRAMVP